MVQRNDEYTAHVLWTLRYGHHQAAIDYRRSFELQAFSRETKALWQSQIPAATTLLEPEQDITRWPHTRKGLWRYA